MIVSLFVDIDHYSRAADPVQAKEKMSFPAAGFRDKKKYPPQRVGI